jgi:hypothetical protein
VAGLVLAAFAHPEDGEGHRDDDEGDDEQENGRAGG